MKKILLMATAALAIAGCSQNEEFENVGQKAEINFGSIVGNSTRADITTDTNFENFSVNGYTTENEMIDGTATLTSFFTGEEVNRDEVNRDKWTHTNAFYWPNNYVHFFATSPAQSLTVTDNTGYPKFTYTVGKIDDQKDLLVANLMNKQKSNDVVQLTFQHALTQVNFSIKGDTKGFDYKVSELIVKSVDGAGTFTYDGSDKVGGWESDKLAGGTYSVKYTQGTEIALTNVAEDLSTTTKFDNDASKSLFMLLPQTMVAASEVSITYIAAPTGKTGDQNLQTFKGTKKVALTGKWEAGKKIRYTLTLTSDAKPITIGAPTVSGWNSKDDTETPLETPPSSN